MICVAALTATGCGVKTPDQLPVRTLPDGRLSVDPPPLTLDDLAGASTSSPRGTLLRLWFAIQWGAQPMIVDAYAAPVHARLGGRLLTDAWSLRRALVIGSRPRILDVTRQAGTVVVTYMVESRTQQPASESATMIRAGNGWRILYDTMLADALAAYVSSGGTIPGVSGRSVAARDLAARRLLRDIAVRARQSGARAPTEFRQRRPLPPHSSVRRRSGATGGN